MRFELEPEVAGGLGEKTVMDTSQFPPLVSSLHYEVDGWLGDELLESFPCFIATETLAKKIKDSGLSGVEILDVFISKSSNFEELHPNTELPSFKWLYVNGDKSKDFSLNPDNLLLVSKSAYEVISHFSIVNCEVREIVT